MLSYLSRKHKWHPLMLFIVSLLFVDNLLDLPPFQHKLLCYVYAFDRRFYQKVKGVLPKDPYWR